jgi:ubiquitin-like modifier-activating enzyme ATG7
VRALTFGRSSTLKPTSVPLQSVRAEGFIKNVNTIEDFKKLDKDALLQTAARQVSLRRWRYVAEKGGS